MAFNTFSAPRAQRPFQFVPYSGPPEPQRLSQQPPSKLPRSPEQGNEDDPMTKSSGVETVDLTQMSRHPYPQEI
jgi:hypothetical protein